MRNPENSVFVVGRGFFKYWPQDASSKSVTDGQLIIAKW